MPEDQELNNNPEENVQPDGAPESNESSGAEDVAQDDAKDSPEGTVIGKTNPEDASPEEAEAAMLAMMEGSEVGEGDDSEEFDERLADLPEAEKISPDAIDYGETIARPADFQQIAADKEPKENRPIDMLLDVSLPITIELGRTSMSINDILALGPGSVIELNKLAGEPVEVKVNLKTVALGEVVVVDENFGVRITQLMSPEDRLKTLQN